MPSLSRTTRRSSIHQHSPTGDSFNHDLYDDAPLTPNEEQMTSARGGASDRKTPLSAGRPGERGVISCYHPEPPVYIASFDPIDPALTTGPEYARGGVVKADRSSAGRSSSSRASLYPRLTSRTPAYERGPLKVRNATSADRSSSSKISAPMLPTAGQSPPVWFNRHDLDPANLRPLRLFPDPKDDVFAPTGDPSQTQKVPLAYPAGNNVRRRPDRATPTKVKNKGRDSLAGLFGHEGVDKRRFEKMGKIERGTPLPTSGPQQTTPRRSARDTKTPERFASAVFGGIGKWYKKVTKKSPGRKRS